MIYREVIPVLLFDFPYIDYCFLLFTVVVNEENRRKIAGWTIMFTCVGVLVLTYAASNLGLPRWVIL